jgi:lipoprotein-anchoring transpeptidase ErfK/SrfK
VHIQLKFSDGSTFGVGIPVIAFFSKPIKDATALQNATTVKINGKPVTGGRWFFEPVSGHPGYPLEGDYRLQNPWPAHAQIFVDIAAKGLSAGDGLAYNDSLTLSFATGASHVAIVNNATHELTLYTDGKVAGHYPVSLGATNTPTAHGIKVIMEKGRSICMSGPGYHECGVKYTQRLTYGGEYLHSAPWNCLGSPGCVGPQNNIGRGNSSNGCTNLRPDDAATLYHTLEIGDIVKYPNADGPQMTMGMGYGDWNVPWSQWLTGGDVAKI